MAMKRRKKLNVALIYGGTSSERKISLRSGEEVFKTLDKDKYTIWRYDPPKDLGRLITDAKNIHVALIMLHGKFGEDGTIQGLLDLLGIPYQCSGVLASALAINKIASKMVYRRVGLPVARDLIIRCNEKYDIDEIIEKLSLPLVVKPSQGGSSIGTGIAKTKRKLTNFLKDAFRFDSEVIVEEYLKGREVTGCILGNQRPVALPLVEIIPSSNYLFFDFEAKYKEGATEEICPARISTKLTRKAQRHAVLAHQALWCKGYSRTDMIVKDDEVYILETNTIPGMTANSLFPRAARAAGIEFSSLLDRLIKLAIDSKTSGQN